MNTYGVITAQQHTLPSLALAIAYDDDGDDDMLAGGGRSKRVEMFAFVDVIMY